MLLEAVFDLTFQANLRFVELRPPIPQDGLFLNKPFFDVAHRVQVLVDPLLVNTPKLALDILHIAGGRIENTAIERQAGLLLLDLRPVRGRKQVLKNTPIISRRRDVHPECITRKRCGAHTVLPRQHQGIQIGRPQVFRSHLVNGDGIGPGARDQVDIVTRQPAVGMDMAADAPLDMRQAGEHGEPITVMCQRLVRGGKSVFRTGILREPVVLADRAWNIETGETGWVFTLHSCRQRLTTKGLQER